MLYKNVKTGATIETICNLGGDWVLDTGEEDFVEEDIDLEEEIEEVEEEEIEEPEEVEEEEIEEPEEVEVIKTVKVVPKKSNKNLKANKKKK